MPSFDSGQIYLLVLNPGVAVSENAILEGVRYLDSNAEAAWVSPMAHWPVRHLHKRALKSAFYQRLALPTMLLAPKNHPLVTMLSSAPYYSR